MYEPKIINRFSQRVANRNRVRECRPRYNSPATFCFAVAGCILAVATLGYTLNHTLQAGLLAGLFILEGLLIEEATLHGLLGLGCFYLFNGLICRVNAKQRAASV